MAKYDAYINGPEGWIPLGSTDGVNYHKPGDYRNINHNPPPGIDPEIWEKYFQDLPPMTETWGPRRMHKVEKKVSQEAIHHVTLSKLMPILEREVRADEEFYEYVDEPEEAKIEWTFEIEYHDGRRAPWDSKRDPDFMFGVYVWCIANFELPPL